MRVIDKLAWLYIENRQLLGARSKGQKSYYIPGGKRELGESDEDALAREIREELSVRLNPATIAFAGAFTAQADGKPAGVMVKVSCYFANYAGDIRAAAEIEEVNWLKHGDREKCSPAMRQVMDWLKAENRID